MEFKIVVDYWGKHAHITEVADHEATLGKVKRLCKVSQRHTSYQISMVVEDIQGITNLNGVADLYSKAGIKTRGLMLHHVMLTKFKLPDRFLLIT